MEYQKELEDMIIGYQTLRIAQDLKQKITVQKAELETRRIKRDMLMGLSDLITAKIHRIKMGAQDYGKSFA